MSSKLLSGFVLGPWKVEPLRGVISGTNGESHHLEPKVMDIFVFLAEHANELVTRNQLLDVAWSGSTAFDEQLTRAISEIRRALHDDPGDPRYVETVPKRGYRLIGQIRLLDVTRLEKNQIIPQPHQRKMAFVILTALTFALVYFAYNAFVKEGVQEQAPAITNTVPRPTSESESLSHSIAVLPFVNMSDDPGNEYFSDGLSEEILSLLAKTPGLKVIGRTSSFAFKGKNEDLRIIGQTLGVKTILEGSVRKSGERVRITAQLVDVSDGTHIWSESYDRTMTDIFAVQDDVAASIIDGLQIHVSAIPTRGRPTEDTEAYELYLEARVSLYGDGAGDPEELMLRAIELDPEFAEAYELLAATYWYQAGSNMQAAEGQNLMFEAAAKALAIDPNLTLAQAYYRMGNLETGSILGGIEAFQRVVLEQPNNTEPLNALAWDLLLVGYPREALGFAQRFVELDPLSSYANYRLFEALYAAGSISDAVTALGVAIQLNGEFDKWLLGELNLLEKQDDIAIGYFEADLQRFNYNSSWVRELVTAGRNSATGQAYLDRRIPEIVASMPEEDAYGWQLDLTRWYLFFGFLDRYFELILATDITNATWTDAENLIYTGTKYRRLGFTAHPEYLEVAETLDFIELWEQRGPPDFCEKVGDEWVCE